MLTDEELDTVCDVITEHESLIPWMYCDDRGFVTVGVGDKVSVHAALTMPFVHIADGKHATADEIERAFYRVQAFFHDGLTASAYIACSDLRLPVDFCRRRLSLRVQEEFVPGVVKHCPQFASFPLAAKLVLVDICYNVGVVGFAAFDLLIFSCNARQFLVAAKEGHTKKKGEDPKDVTTWGRRNTWRYKTMLQAAADYAWAGSAQS